MHADGWGFVPPKGVDSVLEHFPSNQLCLIPPTCQYPTRFAQGRFAGIINLRIDITEMESTQIYITFIDDEFHATLDQVVLDAYDWP
jgi:hypothetical protein